MRSQERAAYIFGGGCLIVILVVLFTKEQLSNDQRAIMRFLIALCAAMLSYFFVGKLTLNIEGRGQAINAGSSFAVFVLLYTLVDPMKIKSATANVVPAVVPKSATVAEAQKVLQDAGQYDGKTDGVQDHQLTDAVSAWQKATNRQATGVIQAPELPALRAYLRSHRIENPQAINDPVIYRRHIVFINSDGPAGGRRVPPLPDWQPMTALKTDDGQNIDADTASIVTLPMDHIGKETIALGDDTLVYNTRNQKTEYAQVGDVGPRTQSFGRRLSFEVSPYLAAQLGIPNNYRNGGVDHVGEVVCLVFPGSGEKHLVPLPQVKSRVDNLFDRWGGLPRLKEELAKP